MVVGSWLFVLDTSAAYTYAQAQGFCAQNGAELAPLKFKESAGAAGIILAGGRAGGRGA